MRSLPWMPWWSAAYLVSTARYEMSPVERCLYLELLFNIFEGGGRIPNNAKALARMALMTDAEFEKAWPVVGKHIVPCDDEFNTYDPESDEADDCEWLTNVRALEVVRQQQESHASKVEAGRLGGVAKAKRKDG